MIVGFNHNVTYRGTSFHVQTEDSGRQRPQLVTLLYHGGTIISSQKTLYADIIKVDNLDQVVEELAKEQHKGMLRRLTQGEFDRRIVELGIPFGTSGGSQPPRPQQSAPAALAPVAAMEEEVKEPEREEIPEEVAIVAEPVVDKFRKTAASHEPTLDELIYAYLTAGRNRS